jgi:hypothetical protein
MTVHDVGLSSDSKGALSLLIKLFISFFSFYLAYKLFLHFSGHFAASSVYFQNK